MRELGLDPAKVAILMGSEPPTMLGLLAAIDEDHGGMDNYLAAIDHHRAIERIGARLLEH